MTSHHLILESNKTFDGTTRAVKELHNILKRFPSGKINFAELMTKDLTFDEAVQQLFHLSFLVKDGHAGLSPNDQGVPTVGK